MKRSFLTFLVLILASLSVNAYNYNETYSNLSIEQNGWCVDFTTTFNVYNETEYNLHKDDNEYASYTNISSAIVKIYSGPFDSLPLLLDSTTSTTGNFSYKFTSPNDYLLEIYPTGSFNDYHELISIDACKRANSNFVVNTTTVATTKLYDKSYIYTDIKISLNQTDMLSEKNITLKEIKGISQNGLTALNNAIKSFSVKGVNTNYSNMDIEISLVSIDTSKNTKGYFYQDNAWIEKPVEINQNKVTFKSASYGIYAITSEEIPKPQELLPAPVVETPKTQSVPEEIIPVDTTVESSSETPSNETTSANSSSSTIYIIMGFVVLILCGGGVYMFLGNKKKTENNLPPVDVLNSYNDIYNHAKKYVQDYKLEYGKDQIYRALESVNVPRDIIDKVFLEEYNS